MIQTIALKRVRIVAFHGVHKEERILGAPFFIDATVQANVAVAATSDDLKGTIDYAHMFELIKQEMAKPSNLLECVLYRISERIRQGFEGINYLKLVLEKPSPPFGGQCDASVVTLEMGAKKSNKL